MTSDCSSIKVKVLLMYSFNSSCDFSFNLSFISSSFVLNTLPLNGKIRFLKKSIIFSHTRNNSSVDFKTLFFAFCIAVI